ncbi:Y-family DNA polymerase [Foetidibacter luteolus]|uniref:Y-family DNA polymerase n=1 Tax=Foetidibacter luteolus TaxID=2608880 RepID=UPI00129B464A|nr:DNA polymerase Y family protein [Foetidibacter luteolus]
MQKRFVAIWFRHLKTDWLIKRQPQLAQTAFALALQDHGRLRITEVSAIAKAKGIYAGMVAADAKVLVPGIQIVDDQENLSAGLLEKMGHWSIRFTPVAAVDFPDGLILDVSGCAHLWGGEETYLKDMLNRFKKLGYHTRVAIADTIGTAWAISRYGRVKAIIGTGEQAASITPLPPAALRLPAEVTERLHKLGLYQVGSFMNMQRSVLRRRFGKELLLRLNQALGLEEEIITPLCPVEPWQERLPCMEPITTRKGIEAALEQLLQQLCSRMQRNGIGIRKAVLNCYRVDDDIQTVSVETNHASLNGSHLFKLFELEISLLKPGWGIELFVLEAVKTEDVKPVQETFFTLNSSLQSRELAELLDNLAARFGNAAINRYLPAEHHLPEKSLQLASSLDEQPSIAWPSGKVRPIHLLREPQQIEVTAPIPDYPPMNFRYKGKLHTVKKADACERIEAEWWIARGLHRDYYVVEDEEGKRYWLFRLGHYDEQVKPGWFIHGFFE